MWKYQVSQDNQKHFILQRIKPYIMKDFIGNDQNLEFCLEDMSDCMKALLLKLTLPGPRCHLLIEQEIQIKEDPLIVHQPWMGMWNPIQDQEWKLPQCQRATQPFNLITIQLKSIPPIQTCTVSRHWVNTPTASPVQPEVEMKDCGKCVKPWGTPQVSTPTEPDHWGRMSKNITVFLSLDLCCREEEQKK